MAYRDIDVNVSNETKSMLLQVQKFSMEVMRPAGIQLDLLSSPEEVIAKGSPLWKVFKGFRELDLHLLQIPKALGGMALVFAGLAKAAPEWESDSLRYLKPLGDFQGGSSIFLRNREVPTCLRISHLELANG